MDNPATFLIDLWTRWNTLQRWVGFWSLPIELPPGLNLMATIVALMSLIVTTGLALGSVAILLTSILVLYLLLTEVFGFRFEFALR